MHIQYENNISQLATESAISESQFSCKRAFVYHMPKIPKNESTKHMPKKKPYDGQFTQRGLMHKNENEGGDSHTHPTENIKEELLCLLGIVYAKMITDADGESDESDELYTYSLEARLSCAC